MLKYELQLRNDKLKTYTIIGWILFSIQITAFIAMAFFFEDKDVRSAAKTGLLIIAIVSLIMYFFRNTKYAFGLAVLLFWCPTIWIGSGNYLAGGISGFIFLLHSLATMKKVVRVFEHYVIYPRFPADNIPWKNISTLMLKDGLLTLDLKNNKLMQNLVDDHTRIDEKEFNDFCREQLNKAH
jgi:hypothetical protein